MSYPFDFRYYIIDPDEGGPVRGQLYDCLGKAGKLLTDSKEFFPVSFNCFFDPNEEPGCEKLVKDIECSGITEVSVIAPTVIAQAPANGNSFQLVISGFVKTPVIKAVYPSFQGNRYAKAESDDQKWVYISVDGCETGYRDIGSISDKSFKQLSSILESEDMGFTDIVRQWNYIPDIVSLAGQAGLVSQNYQEFNEIRAKWYTSGGLSRDFPAATGIGTRGNTIRLQAIAARPGKGFRILSLRNPVQQNAHQYSKDKLVGTIRKSAPLFERGKVIFGAGRGYIWVSGTAAIRGEESIAAGLTGQTNITCDNIENLISLKNLKDHGLDIHDTNIDPVYIRAYVKYRADGSAVKNILDKRYPGAIIHVLEGDVCRDELLVEVEAEFSIG